MCSRRLVIPATQVSKMEVVTSAAAARTKKKMKVCDPALTDIGLMNESKIGGFGQQGKGGRGGCIEHEPKQNQVGTVMLFGVPIVSLVMDGKERLCLAQISSTLLKEFSYNEIHNRRVALGITCIQCTPVQLEILRRAGAMPVTSRRCGMITKREAERLCQSFLGDHAPPQLPENFAFEVYHECAWGCRGAFVPSRYNSSRAKCIRCTFCQLFFSPNKFIFHSHRLPDSRYVQPDAANFNSWRRHLKLCGDPPEEVETSSSPGLMTAQIVHAWEDVKAMFNGGTRKRLLAAGSMPSPPPNNSNSLANKTSAAKRSSPPVSSSDHHQIMSKSDIRNTREKYSPPFISSSSSTLAFTAAGNNLSRSAPVVVPPPPPPTYAPASITFNPSTPQSSYLSSQGLLGHELQPTSAGPQPPGNLTQTRMVDIWNPGFSAAAAAAAAAAVAASAGTSAQQPQQSSRTSNTSSGPFPFHPLALPWLRRPIFPFNTSTHPFGPTCSKLFETGGGISPETSLPPPTINGTSAFKPVGGLRNAAEQWFSWLNNNNGLVVGGPPTLNGSMYPEDLSAASVGAPGGGIPDFSNAKLYPFDMSAMMVDSAIKQRKNSKRPASPQDSDEDDEETVDIESTEVGEADSSGARGVAWRNGKKVSQNHLKQEPSFARYEKIKKKRRFQDIQDQNGSKITKMKCSTTSGPSLKSFRKHRQESPSTSSEEAHNHNDNENVDSSCSSDRGTPDVLSLTD